MKNQWSGIPRVKCSPTRASSGDLRSLLALSNMVKLFIPWWHLCDLLSLASRGSVMAGQWTMVLHLGSRDATLETPTDCHVAMKKFLVMSMSRISFREDSNQSSPMRCCACKNLTTRTSAAWSRYKLQRTIHSQFN